MKVSWQKKRFNNFDSILKYVSQSPYCTYHNNYPINSDQIGFDTSILADMTPTHAPSIGFYT